MAFGLGVALTGFGGSLLSLLFSFNPDFGRALSLKSFCIVVLGGLDSFAGVAFGSLALSLAEGFGLRYMPAALQNLISFVVLVVVLIVFPKGIAGMIRSIRRCLSARCWAVVAVAAAAAVPLVAPHADYLLDVAFLVLLYGAMATGWNVLGGFAGQVSFGHAAFLGIGAYTAAILVAQGWPIWATALPAGLLAALYSLLIGWPSFRLRGPYFSIATIGIGEATRLVALNWTSLTGGASGLTLSSAPSPVVQYYAALALCCGAVGTGGADQVVAFRLWRSRRSARTPMPRRRSASTRRCSKTQALAVSAFILGVSGCVYAMHYLFISPDSVFGFSTSISLVVMPIVGGLGTVLGPLLGAAHLHGVMREQFEANFQNLDLLVFGVLLCAIVLFEPGGRARSFRRLAGVRWNGSAPEDRGRLDAPLRRLDRGARRRPRRTRRRDLGPDRAQRRRQVDALQVDRGDTAATSGVGHVRGTIDRRGRTVRNLPRGRRLDASDRTAVPHAQRAG